MSTPSPGLESLTEWGVMLPDGTVDPYRDREEAEMNAGHGFVVSREVEIRTSPWQMPTTEPPAGAGWTGCAREGCGFVAFDGFEYCPDHLAAGGAS